MAVLNRNDILFAHKAINILPGLTEATRRVAGAIIDHFNKQDGRCYPSIDRLAWLLGIDRATVIRATDKLHRQGYVRKVSHGGQANCARYFPNWNAFREKVAEWDARMKSRDVATEEPVDSENGSVAPAVNVASLRLSKSQGCDVKGRSLATQTLRMNQSKEPLRTEPAETGTEKPPHQSQRMTPSGLWKGENRLGHRNHSPLVHGSRGVSHDQAARTAAEKRWYRWIQGIDQDSHARVIEWMTEDRREGATQAEMRYRGGGMDFILLSLQQDVSQLAAVRRAGVHAGLVANA